VGYYFWIQMIFSYLLWSSWISFTCWIIFEEDFWDCWLLKGSSNL